MSESILLEAHNLVNGDRHDDYGGWRKDYETVAALFKLLTDGKYDMTPAECVRFMLAVKLSREARKHKRDNLVDLCGYSEGLNILEDGGHE